MKTSDVVQLLRAVEMAMEAAGRGEFRALKMIQVLDDYGIDLVQRDPSPLTTTQANVEAATHIARLVDPDAGAAAMPTDNLGADPDRLFAD